MRVIVVLGLPHSRTTPTGFFLSDKKSIFLGEVFNNYTRPKRLTSENTEHICSCGEKYEDCDFWASIEGTEPLLRVKKIVEKAESMGYDTIITSGDLTDFYTFRALNLDPKVKLCVRNFSGWFKSMKKAYARKNEKISFLKLLGLYVIRNAYYLMRFRKKDIVTLSMLNALKTEDKKLSHHVYGANRTKYAFKNM